MNNEKKQNNKIPAGELERLEALRSYRVLDTPSEQEFDDITFLASTICETPIALTSLVDSDRQWFKSRVGIDATETPREDAFCQHTILGAEPLIIEDAQNDERFSANPLVTGDPRIRFYAGAPLVTPGGHALGSLCVIDREPRRLSTEQVDALRALSRQVVVLMELRRSSRRLAEALEGIRELQRLIPICSWCRRVRSDGGYWEAVEEYVSRRTGAGFTHGICEECSEKELR